jgi:protein tyrosine phosphatase
MDMSLKISKNTKQPNNNSGDPARFLNINFFASQGPLPNTCAHHLQMIFENNIDFVIMLTKVTEEDGKGI